MRKGFYFCLPSVSVTNIITPVIDAIGNDCELIFYNLDTFKPAGAHTFQFRAYPAWRNGYHAGCVDAHTSYFRFGEILIDTADHLMDFLLQEVEKEKPDFILHSHLAVWGKLLSRYCGLPAINLFTTIVLDPAIMLPLMRGNKGTGDLVNTSVSEAMVYMQKAKTLYRKLQLKEHPDIWDIYVNKQECNIACILKYFQPRHELFGPGYHFVGFPLTVFPHASTGRLIYISLGTVFNRDIAFYKLCMQVVEKMNVTCVLSIGNKIQPADLGTVPSNVQVVRFANQVSILKEASVFISRGGMASVHEAVYTVTPLIVIPEIPEQKINAEKIHSAGIGIHIPSHELTAVSLHNAITDLLKRNAWYTRNIIDLLEQAPPLPAEKLAADIIYDCLLQ